MCVCMCVYVCVYVCVCFSLLLVMCFFLCVCTGLLGDCFNSELQSVGKNVGCCGNSAHRFVVARVQSLGLHWHNNVAIDSLVFCGTLPYPHHLPLIKSTLCTHPAPDASQLYQQVPMFSHFSPFLPVSCGGGSNLIDTGFIEEYTPKIAVCFTT